MLSINSLPTIPLDPELHRRLLIAGGHEMPLLQDARERLRLLVHDTLVDLANRLEDAPEFHRPSRWCRCGGPGCSRAEERGEATPEPPR